MHLDLLAAGLIPDPYLDRNEELVQWIGETDVAYTTTFELADEGHERIDLVFDGLDTVATVTLGESVVGHTRNEHRRYRFDATAQIRSGERDLRVEFGGALREAREAESRIGGRPRVGNPNPYNALRKMACNFGWDWGPVLITSGIHRPVSVHQWSTARLASVVPLVTVDGLRSGDAVSGRVAVRIQLERTGSEPVAVAVALTAPDGTASGEASIVTTGDTVDLDLAVDDPELWWPRGYGSQPLYELDVTVSRPTGEVTRENEASGEAPLDTWHRSVGFRDVEVRVEPDEHGTGFAFHVNGRYVYIKGANWIPEDCFLPRIGVGDYERALGDAIDADMNLIRVWGGGQYESDAFYDICDREGLLVWQDFAFACAAYSEEPELWNEVEAEARENVARLAPHPSLVFWNGSNENVEGYWHWGWKEALEEGTSWGLGYYDELLPRVLAEVDPTRAYRPSSPFNPDVWSDVRNPEHGTVHSWVAWNQRDYLAYGDSVPRFVAEFGFQGPPNWSTLTRAVHDDPLAPTSPGVLWHQKADDGNGKLERGYTDHLPHPTTMDDWHFTTQLNQARALTYGIEHFRSWSPRTAGTIVWQLNDCWPVSSWAAVDGDGGRKPLWYALRAVNAPRLLTVQPRDGGLAVVASNDTDDDWAESVTVCRIGLDGEVLLEVPLELRVERRATGTFPLPTALVEAGDARREALVVRSGSAAPAWWWFVEDLELELAPADLDVEVSREGSDYVVDVVARTFVKHLCLAPDRLDPAATVDSALVTLEPGARHRFHVKSVVDLDSGALTRRPVLNSVNALLHAAKVSTS